MLTACDSIRRARPLLGTFVEIAVEGATPAAMSSAVEAAFDAIAKIHALMSFHAAGSDVSRLNAHAWSGPVIVHAWTHQVLATAIDLRRRSAGVFDIAVAPTLQRLGLLPRASGDETFTPIAAETAGAIELLPGQRVRFKQRGTRIDLGGIAKGFAVDRAIYILREHDMPGGLVNAGGDLAVFGAAPALVGVRDPRDPGRLLCRVRLSNQALASTAPSFDPVRSSKVTGSSVIDPHGGKPISGIRGATVRAPSGMIADALTKVVMVAGTSAADLLEHYRADALLVPAVGGVQLTRGLQDAMCLAA